MIEILQRETPKFIPQDLWPPNSPDLGPVTIEYGRDAGTRVSDTSSGCGLSETPLD